MIRIPKLSRRRQRGIAALELALLLPIMLVLLALALYLGRVVWHYSVAHKAAQSAARFLSTVPVAQMRDTARVHYVIEFANAIVDAEMTELNPGPVTRTVTILCNGLYCSGNTTPATVRVHIELPIEDILFPNVSQSAGLINVDVVSPYLGR